MKYFSYRARDKRGACIIPLTKLLINARKRNRMAAEVTAYGSASEQLIPAGFGRVLRGG